MSSGFKVQTQGVGSQVSLNNLISKSHLIFAFFLFYVKEPPVKFVNKEEDIVATAYEAESVTLTSYVSKENAHVRWLRHWEPVEGERFLALVEGHKRTLTIEPLRRSDAGEYTCDVNTDQIHFSLLVKG